MALLKKKNNSLPEVNKEEERLKNKEKELELIEKLSANPAFLKKAKIVLFFISLFIILSIAYKVYKITTI